MQAIMGRHTGIEPRIVWHVWRLGVGGTGDLNGAPHISGKPYEVDFSYATDIRRCLPNRKWRRCAGASGYAASCRETLHSQQVCGWFTTCSLSIWTNLDFPIPASPLKRTICP